MATLPDRIAFLAQEPRLSIADACRAQPLTREQLADLLHRPSGSLSSPRTMLKRGALRIVGRTPSRGSREGADLLQLDPSWGPSLDEAIRQRPPGAFVEKMELLLVSTPTTPQACKVIATGAPDVLWGIPLRGEQMGLLLAAVSSRQGAAALRALKALRDGGAQALRLHLGEPLSSDELQNWAQEVSNGQTTRGLPSG